MEILRQNDFGFFGCHPDTQSCCQVKFYYRKEYVSLHVLSSETLEELFEEGASHRVCDEYIEEGRCKIFLPDWNGFWHSFPRT